MKFQLKNSIALIATLLLFSSCSKDSINYTISGQGKLDVEFDNVFGNANLLLNSQANITSQGETLYISNIKYIISNIVLTKEDGTTFVYPKSSSYFIVSETSEDSQVLKLEKIPAGNYSSIKFGVGVDEQQYNAGQTVQEDFFATAQAQNMAANWIDGYNYLSLEGTFTSSTVTTPTLFKVQTKHSGTNYNYTNVTLNFPDKALVRPTITPEVHIFTDVAKVIDGINKIKFSDNNTSAGAMIMSGENLLLITSNISAMFTVNHVHND